MHSLMFSRITKGNIPHVVGKYKGIYCSKIMKCRHHLLNLL